MTTASTDWLETQTDGPVQQFEKVPHTYLNETSGEMHCSICGQTEKTRGNRSRSFMTFIEQTKAFERFTEAHLHQEREIP